MLSTRGAAFVCWQIVIAGEITLYVTHHILTEIRKLPGHKSLKRFATFTPRRVERFIEELLDVATMVGNPDPAFVYPRDPDDAHYVDLAISTGSMLVVTHDKDLLDLMDDKNSEGVALRSLHPEFTVLTPPMFLDAIRGKP